MIGAGRAAGRRAAHPADPGHRIGARRGDRRPSSAGPDPGTRGRPASPGCSRTPACRPASRRCRSGPVPHYVSQAPSPKATLALLHRVEEILDIEVPLGTLPQQADEWEAEVSQIAAEDEEISEYIRALEEREEADEPLQPASGESIAAEFERYLRRRGPARARPAGGRGEPGVEQVVVDAADPHTLGQWWADALGWVFVGDAPDEVEIRPAPDVLPGLIFVPVPEAKTIKNRLHLDFRPDDQEAEVDRFLRLGARRVDVGQGTRRPLPASPLAAWWRNTSRLNIRRMSVPLRFALAHLP